MVMKKNIYSGLILSLFMVVVSTPLFADVSPTNEKLADIAKTETSASEQLEPSELQREQEEHKAEVMPPSESTKVLPKVGHNKHKTEKNVPATSIKEHLEPSELQRQQEEHNK